MGMSFITDRYAQRHNTTLSWPRFRGPSYCCRPHCAAMTKCSVLFFSIFDNSSTYLHSNFIFCLYNCNKSKSNVGGYMYMSANVRGR